MKREPIDLSDDLDDTEQFEAEAFNEVNREEGHIYESIEDELPEIEEDEVMYELDEFVPTEEYIE